VIAAAIGLVVLAPILVVIGLLIALDDGLPVVFHQARVGRGGVPFVLHKFRTMRVGAESQSALTVGHDGRVTRVGRWLRAHKLDELPQLVNVLGGDMSLVGPRPEVPVYVAHYTGEQCRVLQLVPGMTDPASLAYWNESTLLAMYPDPEAAYRDIILPDKIRRNLAYAEHAGWWSDLGVILRTVFRGQAGGSEAPRYRG